MIPFQDSVYALEVLNFHFPRYEELPNIDLYRDQLLSFIEERLKTLCVDSKEKLLTASMVNNYVKQKLITPPSGKKYDREHIAYFIVISALKQVLSISELHELLKIQIAAYPLETAYDYFACQFEHAIQAVFSSSGFSIAGTSGRTRPEAMLVRSSVLSFASKLYLQKYLQYQKSENSIQS